MEVDRGNGASKIQKQIDEEYRQYRYGENSPKNLQKGIKMLTEFFPNYSEEELEARSKRINLEMVFEEVKECFFQEFGYSCEALEFNNLYQRDVTSYLFNDETHPAFVHIDELLESSALLLLLVMFKWSKEIEDADKCGDCFSYMLFLFNEMVIFGELPDENALRESLRIVEGDEQILQLAEGCYWTIIVFSIAHEIAHYYFTSVGKAFLGNRIQEELEADSVAYHIVLRCIMLNELTLAEYSYLAPLMYMDFYDMYEYVDSLLYETTHSNGEYPSLEERKTQLLSIVEKDIYELDTEDGNTLYAGFSDVVEAFKKQAYEKKQLGYFDSIIKKGNNRNCKEKSYE